MKRAALILYLIALLGLSGCGGRLFSSRLDMEHLRPIQTISLDRTEDGVQLGVCSGTGPGEEAPLVLVCRAPGIEPAIARLQDYASEDELFYAHVQYILLGESMTDGHILSLLDWVERSPAMRMDTALLPVRGSAADALTGAASETADATGQLAALDREERLRGQRIASLREVAASLLERGCALCLGVRAVPADEVRPSEGPDAIVSEGLVVLRDGAEAVWLTGEETLGAELLTGRAEGARVEIEGGVLEILQADTQVKGEWDEGGDLTGLTVRCALDAGILEREEGADAEPGLLEARLSEEARRWIEAAVARAQALDLDYADLLGRLRGTDKDAERFSALSVTVTAQGAVDRSYDLSDRGGDEP